MTLQTHREDAKTPRPRMTYEQFLEWDGENHHVEWVNEEMVEIAPVTDEHSYIQIFLVTLLQLLNRRFNVGRPLADPFQMKAAPNLPGRAPDILFVLNQNLSRIRKLHLEGPADIAVEIISPGSAAVDRIDKFFEYQKGGVREYWLIDPIRKHADFFVLGDDGQYKPANLQDGIFRSTVFPQFWMNVEWLWTRPDEWTVLREWKLI